MNGGFLREDSTVPCVPHSCLLPFWEVGQWIRLVPTTSGTSGAPVFGAGRPCPPVFTPWCLVQVAPAYGIPVIVHSDHCAKKLLPWFDGMLQARTGGTLGRGPTPMSNNHCRGSIQLLQLSLEFQGYHIV